MTTGNAEKNPSKDPLADRSSDMDELMTSLTGGEMPGYIRKLDFPFLTPPVTAVIHSGWSYDADAGVIPLPPDLVDRSPPA
jgi:hypothetical protein